MQQLGVCMRENAIYGGFRKRLIFLCSDRRGESDSALE